MLHLDIKVVLVAVCLLLAVAFSGCKKELDDNGFKTLTYTDSISDVTFALEYYFSAKFQLPDNGLYVPELRTNIIKHVLGSEYAVEKDRRLLSVFSDSSYSEYIRFLADDFLPYAGGNDYVLRYSIDLTGRVMSRTDSFICYSRDMYVYTGGAHGTSTSSSYIFNSSTGERLVEQDIFCSGYEDALRAVLVRHVDSLRTIGSMPDSNEYFNNDLVRPNGNVGISGKSVVYTFNPYEIAPYSYGVIRIELTPDDIRDIIKIKL